MSFRKISSEVAVVYPKIYIDLELDKIESIYILYDPRLIPPRKKKLKGILDKLVVYQALEE